MDTANLVLMIILSAMIGFAIGNAWGKATMKHMFSELLNKMTESLRLAAGKVGEKDKKE